MNKKIALIGNPNCGKTTLFNAITGTYQRVGNWAGVTVDKKQGEYKKDRDVSIIDLPGIYSLNPISADEKVVIDYLNESPPDLLINVLDATNLERNLYLTCKLSQLDIPTVIAVNFSDQLDKNQIQFNVKYLSNLLGVPVILVSALKNTNIDKLMNTAKVERKKIKKIDVELYEFISNNLDKIIQNKKTKAQKITEKADRILMSKVLGYPIFFCIILLVYFLSISIGGRLGGKIEDAFNLFGKITSNSLLKINAPNWLKSMLVNTVIQGTGTILGFLPQVLILFTLLAILEQTGYVSRIAFLLDSLLRKAGLSGKSFLPLMVSNGCTVTGLLATKIVEETPEKRVTIFVAPFMPCGAKMAVFGWLSYELFDGNPLVSTSLYFLSILTIVVVGAILKRFTPFSSDNNNFILEIPTLRLPAIKDVFAVLRQKTKEFLLKAGTVLFVLSIGLWGLKSFGIHGYTENVEQSFLYIIGNALKYLFYPLGFGSWESSVSILSGILAKESVVETLTYVSVDVRALFNNGFSAYAFMVFIAFSPPCIASLSQAKESLNNRRLFCLMLLMEIVIAYLLALFINVIGHIIIGKYYLIFVIFIGIILLVWLQMALKGISNPCKICDGINNCHKIKCGRKA